MMTRDEIRSRKSVKNSKGYEGDSIPDVESLPSSEILIGWQKIANYLKISVYTCKRRRMEWFKAGLLFYIRVGKPPKRKIATFTNLLQAHMIRKGIV